MSQSELEIFISYRRKDSTGKEWGTSLARNVQQALEARGYKGRVFLDHNKIGPEDFESKILDAIKVSKVFIFILTKESLMRCYSEGDWVRREILQARNSKTKMIFINPDNEFQQNYPDNFPRELDFIKTENHIDLRTGSGFERDMDYIVNEYVNPLFHDVKSNVIFSTDLDCRIFNSGKEIGVVKVGEEFLTDLTVGHVQLEFVSLKNKKIRYAKMCNIEMGDSNIILITFNPRRRFFIRVLIVILGGALCGYGLYYVGKIRAVNLAEEALEYYNCNNTTKAYMELKDAQKRLERYGFEKGDDVYDKIIKVLR